MATAKSNETGSSEVLFGKSQSQSCIFEDVLLDNLTPRASRTGATTPSCGSTSSSGSDDEEEMSSLARVEPMGGNPYGSVVSSSKVISISNFRSLSLIVNILWTFEKNALFCFGHI